MTAGLDLRRTIRATWLALAAVVVALALATHVAGLLGYRLVIIEGSSMAPAIPVGSVVVEPVVPPATVSPGDVVTIRLGTGVLVTHRVAAVNVAGGPPTLETRGDANDSPDPTIIPAAWVVGRVVAVIPVVGFALAFIAMPTGFVTVLSALAALLSAHWLLDDRQDGQFGRGASAERAEGVDGATA